MDESKNVFQLWRENGEVVPFCVRRNTWAKASILVIEKVIIKKWPYGDAFGFAVNNGRMTNWYSSDKKWRESRNLTVGCVGSYQWSLVTGSEAESAMRFINAV